MAGPILAILAALGFAGKAIFIKLIYAESAGAGSPHMDAVTLLALRMLFALPFFAVLYWLGERREGAAYRISRRDLAWLAALGFTGYYLASFLDFWGLQYITAALERLILFTYPAWILLFGAAFLNQPLRARQVSALTLSAAGLAISFAADLNSSRDLWKGSALVLASSLVYALFLTGSSRIVSRIGSLRFSALAVTFSSVFVFAHYWIAHPEGGLLNQSPHVLWLSFLLGLASTAIPIWWTLEAIRRIGAGRVGIIGTVGPVATIFIGHWTVGEPISGWQLAGAVLVLAGVSIVSSRSSGGADSIDRKAAAVD